MNINKVLDELKAVGLDEYDLREVAVKAIRKEFSKRHDIYLGEKEIDAWNINTIEESLKTVYDNQVMAFGSIDNANIYYNFKDLSMRIDSFTDKAIELHRYSMSDNARFVYLLRYAINGTFDKDYHDTNELLDGKTPLNLVRINYDNHHFELKVSESVKVKSFKNGKIIVTGLNKEQADRLKYGLNVVNKFNHNNIIP